MHWYLKKRNTATNEFISDISGIDTQAHSNDLTTIVIKVRDWLKVSTKRDTIPGSDLLLYEFEAFNKKIPDVLKILNISYENMTYYDFCEMVEDTYLEMF